MGPMMLGCEQDLNPQALALSSQSPELYNTTWPS